jgi:hypothetical protein
MNVNFSLEYCGNKLASPAEQLMSRALINRKLSGERFPMALRKQHYAQGSTMPSIPTKNFITVWRNKFKLANVYIL